MFASLTVGRPYVTESVLIRFYVVKTPSFGEQGALEFSMARLDIAKKSTCLLGELDVQRYISWTPDGRLRCATSKTRRMHGHNLDSSMYVWYDHRFGAHHTARHVHHVGACLSEPKRVEGFRRVSTRDVSSSMDSSGPG